MILGLLHHLFNAFGSLQGPKIYLQLQDRAGKVVCVNLTVQSVKAHSVLEWTWDLACFTVWEGFPRQGKDSISVTRTQRKVQTLL